MSDDEVKEIVASVIMNEPLADWLTPKEKGELAENTFYAIRRELGILTPYAEDESVSEIMVNGPDLIFVEREGRIKRLPLAFLNEEEIEEIARRLASKVHREINELNPILDARMEDGSRVHCVYKNIAIGGPALNIRRFPKQSVRADDLIRNGTVTGNAMSFLGNAVQAGMNIFISGGTSSGKTTFLNILSDFIPSEERVIVIEDAAELQIHSPENVIRMEVKEANSSEKGAVTMAELIRSSLRMRPDRIVIGEVRGAEVMEMIQAMNTGHDGSLSTGHGNSPHSMLLRLESMAQAASGWPVEAIRRQIGDAIDLIVHMGRFPGGARRVLAIVEIAGVLNDEYQINPIFQYEFNKGLYRTQNEIMHREKYDRKGISP